MQAEATPPPTQAGEGASTEQYPPSRIAATFARLKAEGRAALMPYLTVGYPDLDTTRAGIPALVRTGADLIELGLPFSDPLIDGPTVQRTNQVAIAAGTRPTSALEITREVRAQGIETPLIAMGSYNLILRHGPEAFVAACAEAGIDGLIIPDLPPEEGDEVADACVRHGRDLIMLIAPTSSDERIATVLRRASGFVYCISLVGITGARASLYDGLEDYIARIRRHTDLPLVVGFGISTAEHVAHVAQFADGAIVASAMLDSLGKVADRPLPERIATLEAFMRGLQPE